MPGILVAVFTKNWGYKISTLGYVNDLNLIGTNTEETARDMPVLMVEGKDVHLKLYSKQTQKKWL